MNSIICYKKTIVKVLIFCTFLVGCDLKSADDYIKLGHELGLKEDYNGAIKLYNKAISKDPNAKEAYVQKGLCYEYLNENDSAIKTYGMLLSKDSNNVLGIYYIGICKFKQHRYQDAATAFSKALSLKGFTNASDSSEVQFTIDWNKDALFNDGSLNYDVPLAEILYNRGFAFYYLNQMEFAISDFKICLSKRYNVKECNDMIEKCLRQLSLASPAVCSVVTLSCPDVFNSGQTTRYCRAGKI